MSPVHRMGVFLVFYPLGVPRISCVLQFDLFVEHHKEEGFARRRGRAQPTRTSSTCSLSLATLMMPAQTGSWISALGALRHSDLFASGASDGALRFWHWDPAGRQIRAAFSAPVVRVIHGARVAHAERAAGWCDQQYCVRADRALRRRRRRTRPPARPLVLL